MFLYRVDNDLQLKLLSYEDAPAVFAMTEESRLYLREWLPWLDAITKEEDTKAYIRSSLHGYAEGTQMNTLILYQGRPAGIAGFNQIDARNRTAYIGYWLHQPFQGLGIMTKAARGLTDYAISELGMNRVEISAAVENQKSRTVAEKAGYRYEGTRRQSEWLYDHFVDHAVYGMLAEEWEINKVEI